MDDTCGEEIVQPEWVGGESNHLCSGCDSGRLQIVFGGGVGGMGDEGLVEGVCFLPSSNLAQKNPLIACWLSVGGAEACLG